jgi:hypothetical protein
MIKKIFILCIICHTGFCLYAQKNDSSKIKINRIPIQTSDSILNMDAVYNRPFLSVNKIPVALGGYVEANMQYINTRGVSDGVSFQMRRFTIFLSSTIYKRIKFLSEIEFEGGTKEINIEFAAIDIELHNLLNIRGGIVMNPIGAFNQNHDGPKWEFVDRPISATQMLPATWSNVGGGIYGKYYTKNMVFAYEAYVTNGFDDNIIGNDLNRTSLAASKKNLDRFEESFNGSPLITGKIAVKHRKIAEVGISYMGGNYNKFEADGIRIDQQRRVDVIALDFNTTLPKLNTYIVGEWAWVWVNVPTTYTQQYGNRQYGGFIDIVQPIFKKQMLGFKKSSINLALRLEYVDWNVGTFTSTGGNIADDIFALAPGISWRLGGQTVVRANYRHHWQRDLLGNPPVQTAGFQAGISSYF